MIFRQLIPLCLLILYGFAYATPNAPVPTIPIANIEIHGNNTTRPEILNHFITFQKGEPLDTAKLRQTRANLLATKLYTKVDIFSHTREDGAHVFIILKESVRLQLAYGGEYSTRKHGRKELWYGVNAEAGIDNFRGRHEEFWFGVGAWERRSLYLSWYKPFLSTPYDITIGTGISAYPDYMLPIDYTDLYARASIGRKTGDYSRLSIGAIPVYRYREIVESALDSTTVILPSFRNEIYEAFGTLGYTIDRRSARFDPKSGWYYAAQLRTNHLYSGLNIPYFQLSNEFRGYRSFSGGDMAALRLRLTLRDRDAGAYHRLTYGGTGEIRGYSDDALGWQFVANSSLLASAKFHKQIYKTPRVPFPLVNVVFAGAGDISFRFDATFIADYARLAHEPQGILTFGGPWQDGMGIGFGTRIVVPEIRQSGCIDLVFGRIDNDEGSQWAPALHLYLDLFF